MTEITQLIFITYSVIAISIFITFLIIGAFVAGEDCAKNRMQYQGAELFLNDITSIAIWIFSSIVVGIFWFVVLGILIYRRYK